ELVLSTMAVLPQVRGEDRAACTALLRTVARPVDEPQVAQASRDLRVEGASFLRVAVIEDDGDIFCTSALGGASIPPADRELAGVTLSTRQVTSGNIQPGRTGSMEITYASPASRDNGQGRRAIVATMDVYALSSFARQANLSADSS